MHGETKPIEVDVEFIGAGEDPWGGYRRGYVGTTTIRQADWGIDYDLGPAAETMELQFFIEGIRQSAFTVPSKPGFAGLFLCCLTSLVHIPGGSCCYRHSLLGSGC